MTKRPEKSIFHAPGKETRGRGRGPGRPRKKRRQAQVLHRRRVPTRRHRRPIRVRRPGWSAARRQTGSCDISYPSLVSSAIRLRCQRAHVAWQRRCLLRRFWWTAQQWTCKVALASFVTRSAVSRQSARIGSARGAWHRVRAGVGTLCSVARFYTGIRADRSFDNCEYTRKWNFHYLTVIGCRRFGLEINFCKRWFCFNVINRTSGFVSTKRSYSIGIPAGYE